MEGNGIYRASLASNNAKENQVRDNNERHAPDRWTRQTLRGGQAKTRTQEGEEDEGGAVPSWPCKDRETKRLSRGGRHTPVHCAPLTGTPGDSLHPLPSFHLSPFTGSLLRLVHFAHCPLPVTLSCRLHAFSAAGTSDAGGPAASHSHSILPTQSHHHEA